MFQTLTFDSVEKLDDANHELGWQIEYRQLTKENFNCRFLVKAAGDVVVTSESLTGSMEVVAAPPQDTYALVVPTSRGYGMVMNGRAITEQSTVLLTPGSDLHATTRKSAGAFVIHIPTALLEPTAHCIAPEMQRSLGHSSISVETPEDKLDVLRACLSETMRSEETNSGADRRMTSSLVEDVVRLLSLPTVQASKARGFSRQVVHKAREFINAHLSTDVRLSEICNYANVEARTLERAFKRELGISPYRYLLSRRLNAARRRLLEGSPEDETVSTIAHGLGFNHMGRFAGSYFEFFGEYPNQTLSQ